MRKLAVALFAAASVLLSGPVLPAGVALADQPRAPQPTTSQPSWLRLDVNSITPQVIESGNGTVTVNATITNVSNRTISQLVGQLRIGVAATTEAAVAAGIAGEVVPNSGTSFEKIGDPLQPGQHETVTMNVPISALAITKPGVYPMLININGTPDYGRQARLATDAVLLPVRSVPGASTPNPGGARQLTVLWPLVDTAPTMLSVATSGQPVLTDDHLATSLADGGRLFNLLDAARHAPASASAALCYAIDPDLLDTVVAMSHGYLVRTSGGGTAQGAGTVAATQWLGILRGVVTGHCVLPLPFADADVAALSRSGALDLEKLAISQEADLAADLKPASIQQLSNVLWPIGNAIDQHTMTDLAGLGPAQNQTTALVEPDALAPPGGSGTVPLTGISTVTPTRAVVVDPLISGALDGSTDRSTVAGAPSQPSSQTVLDTENGIGALLYQSVFGASRDQPMLIAPPRRWSASLADLQGFLTAVGSVIDGQHATATGLAALVGQQPSSGAASLASSPATTDAELPISLTSSIVAQNQTQQDMLDSMHADPTNPTHLQPSALIAPLQVDLLRVASSAWRGSGSAAGAVAADTVSDQLSVLTSSVSISPPPSSISRASSNSPLPVTVSNKLPVDVAVQVTFSGEQGLEGLAPYTAEIPAHSPLTLFINAKLTRTGRFSLIETLTTRSGNTALGPPARLELVSTSYGTIILVVSGVAFGALVLLSARRIYTRARASKLELAEAPAPEQEPSSRS